MKYFLSFVIGGWLIVSFGLLILSVYHTINISDDYPFINNHVDSTEGRQIINYSEHYFLYDLTSEFDSDKGSDIVVGLQMNQKFNDFGSLHSNSKGEFKYNGKKGDVTGQYNPSYISIEIEQQQFMKYRKIGLRLSMLFFLLQTILSYLIFRLVFSYCKNRFYSSLNPRRMFWIGIITTIIGSAFYFKQLWQKAILNKMEGLELKAARSEIWEMFPYVLILGLFIIVVSRFYKEAVILKEQNDLTI